MFVLLSLSFVEIIIFVSSDVLKDRFEEIICCWEWNYCGSGKRTGIADEETCGVWIDDDLFNSSTIRIR